MHNKAHTHTYTLRVTAGVAVIRERVFAQFHQPLNPYRPEREYEAGRGGETKI